MKKVVLNIISDYPLDKNCDSTLETTQETNINNSTSCIFISFHNNLRVYIGLCKQKLESTSGFKDNDKLIKY